MIPAADALPDDVATLKAMVIAATARADRLEHLLAVLRRQRFGKSSEKLAPEQFALALEDSEAATAEAELLIEQHQVAGTAPRVLHCLCICRGTRSRSRRP
jgi:hypothetical protein